MLRHYGNRSYTLQAVAAALVIVAFIALLGTLLRWDDIGYLIIGMIIGIVSVAVYVIFLEK
jgi:Kef-type K+ transport system membrane component KefB